MRLVGSIIGAAAIMTAGPLSAQITEPVARDRLLFDVGAGMSRYGPHAFGGLEASMNRWLAVRGEGLFSLQSRQDWPDYRFTAVAVSAVLSLPTDSRVSPYLLGGYAVSMSQGMSPRVGPLGAVGLRFRLGKVQPFIELRAQHRIGAPLSVGIRF